MSNLWLYYISLVIVIAVTVGMMCFYKKARAFPLNYILLAVYTVFHSYLIAAITMQYKQNTVVGAMVLTLGMFISLTAYACFTKTDMTKCGGFIWTSVMMVFLFFILIFVFNPFRSKWWYLALCCVLIALISMYIIYDTQIIVGGKHRRYALEVDDYCIGALILYSDILMLFLYVLQLMGGGE